MTTGSLTASQILSPWRLKVGGAATISVSSYLCPFPSHPYIANCELQQRFSLFHHQSCRAPSNSIRKHTERPASSVTIRTSRHRSSPVRSKPGSAATFPCCTFVLCFTSPVLKLAIKRLDTSSALVLRHSERPSSSAPNSFLLLPSSVSKTRSGKVSFSHPQAPSHPLFVLARPCTIRAVPETHTRWCKLRTTTLIPARC